MGKVVETAMPTSQCLKIQCIQREIYTMSRPLRSNPRNTNPYSPFPCRDSHLLRPNRCPTSIKRRAPSHSQTIARATKHSRIRNRRPTHEIVAHDAAISLVGLQCEAVVGRGGSEFCTRARSVPCSPTDDTPVGASARRRYFEGSCTGEWVTRGRRGGGGGGCYAGDCGASGGGRATTAGSFGEPFHAVGWAVGFGAVCESKVST